MNTQSAWHINSKYQVLVSALPFALMSRNHTGGVHHRETHIQILWCQKLPYFDHTSNVIISRDTSLYSLHSDVGDYRAAALEVFCHHDVAVSRQRLVSQRSRQWARVFLSCITFKLSILVVTDRQQDAGLPHIHSWQLTDTSPVLCWCSCFPSCLKYRLSSRVNIFAMEMRHYTPSHTPPACAS